MCLRRRQSFLAKAAPCASVDRRPGHQCGCSCCCLNSSSSTASHTPTGSSSSAAFILSPFTCPSDSSFSCPCLKLPAPSAPLCARPQALCWGSHSRPASAPWSSAICSPTAAGDTGTTLTRHMWGGIALSIGMLLCLLARPSWSTGAVPRIYPALLTCVLLTLVFTAHQGGSITHGANYLTEYMPAPLKRSRLHPLHLWGRSRLVLRQANSPHFRYQLRRMSRRQQGTGRPAPRFL